VRFTVSISEYILEPDKPFPTNFGLMEFNIAVTSDAAWAGMGALSLIGKPAFLTRYLKGKR
jgi:hypothetical protein